MQTNCPQCNKLNHINRNNIVECYGFEYSCTCGYYLYINDWMESDAFQRFNDELIAARLKKLMPKCEGCGE
jgi:hypothetical protein